MTPFDAGQEHSAESAPSPVGALPARAAAVYRQEQVSNLSQQELLLMLYDGAIRFCGEGRAAIERGDFNTSYHRLARARDVVTELLAILSPDIQTEATINLRRLYDFCIYSITEVNFTKDVKLLDGVVRTLETLRSAWAEIDFARAVGELTQTADSAAPTALPGPTTGEFTDSAGRDPSARSHEAAPATLSILG